MINLIWGSSFKRAYKKVTIANPDLKFRIAQAMETFVINPHQPSFYTVQCHFVILPLSGYG